MQALKDFGLSENEIEVYLALLKLGATSANKISASTGMKRSTSYDNLALLMNKGIVSAFIKENVHYYKVEEPETLLRILDERKTAIQNIIPELKKIKKETTESSEVSYFEGKKGVFTVLNTLYSGQYKDILFYGSRKKSK
ncbi:MAG: helix-turn-helix domain-containing protein, partial [Candidatus Woesearchaeota archaeon]|nr:helix-turn-helix domain-containing protein [Candidatus Woesearchaeota archaeon]